MYEAFVFVQKGDYANDQKAQRLACWQAFRNNASRVLAAPRSDWDAMLTRYQAEATARYGTGTGKNMADELRSWVTARGLQ